MQWFISIPGLVRRGGMFNLRVHGFIPDPTLQTIYKIVQTFGPVEQFRPYGTIGADSSRDSSTNQGLFFLCCSLYVSY